LPSSTSSRKASYSVFACSLDLYSTPSRLAWLLDGYDIVDVSLNLDKLSSVDDSVEGSVVSSVSFARCVTGHIVVSSGFTAGCDSSGESWVVVDDDDDTLTVVVVVGVGADVDD
jgi:hypothetical protein